MDNDDVKIQKLCRTCKNESSDMQYIFENSKILENKFRFADMLMECASIQVTDGDGLPTLICSICISKLINAYTFKQQCELIDSSFRLMIKKNDIKQEILSTDDLDFNEYSVRDNNEIKTEDCITKIENDTKPNIKTSSSSSHTCQICAKVYACEANLSRHMRQHFPSKRFRCKICNSTLTRMDHLKRHMVIHLKTKPHVCRTCKRGFNKADNLYSHESRCIGQRPNICPICNRGFMRADSLQVHMTSHEPSAENSLVLDSLDNIDNYIEIQDCFGTEETTAQQASEQNDQNSREHILLEPQVNILEGNNCNQNSNNPDHTSAEPLMGHTVDCQGSSDEGDDDNNLDSSFQDNIDEDDEDLKTENVNNIKNEQNSSINNEQQNNDLLQTYATLAEKIKLETLDLPCDQCDKRFSSLVNLEVHKQRHNRKENKNIFSCTQCDKKFTRADHLKRHMNSRHENYKPFKCRLCAKTFTRRDHMLRHLKVHEIDRHTFTCEECQKHFSKEELLVKHRAAKHGIGEKMIPDKKFKCHICDKLFTTEKYRDTHIFAHGNKTKVFRCKGCDQEFESKDDLAKHLKVANDCSRRFLCSECGQRFTKRDYLLVHIRRHRGEKPFKCRFCEKGFPRTTDLKAHEKCHTGEKNHLCIVCGKGFGRAYKLTIHMRTHTGEKPYACTYCDAAFAQSNDLKAHIRRHTGERYYCDICNDAFLMGYMLTQHKKNVHGVDLPASQKPLARLNQSAPQPIKPEIRRNPAFSNLIGRNNNISTDASSGGGADTMFPLPVSHMLNFFNETQQKKSMISEIPSHLKSTSLLSQSSSTSPITNPQQQSINEIPSHLKTTSLLIQSSSTSPTTHPQQQSIKSELGEGFNSSMFTSQI